jgi:4-amino-4-deoxy-L-arabinose transferase-like glycosyltransferase
MYILQEAFRLLWAFRMVMWSERGGLMKRLQPFVPVIGIFCLALLVRLTYNHTVAHNYVLVGDASNYHSLAVNLLRQHCFCLHPPVPTVDRAPLWPSIIASIYAIFGINTYIVRVFLCMLDAGTCVFISLFAKDMFGRRIGMMTGLVAAVYPQLYLYVDWLYSETLYIFLLFAFCYALLRLQRTSRQKWMLWSGVLLGLLALARPNGLLVLGPFILWVVILGWKKILSWKAVARSALIVTLLTLAFVAPWTIRNYVVSHAFIPVATGEGTVLIGAFNNEVVSNPLVYGKWVNPNTANLALGQRYHTADWQGPRVQLAREAAFEHAAQGWIQSHISNLPFLFSYHFLRMWSAIPDEVYFPGGRWSQFFQSMANVFPVLIYPLFAFGLLVTWKRWRELLFLYFMIVLVAVQCIVFYGSARLSSPFQPMLLILAAGGVWVLLQQTRTHNVTTGESKRAYLSPEQPVFDEELESDKIL